MDNMKPLIDAVADDGREEAAKGNEAGRPNCCGARQGGQSGSFCGYSSRSGYPGFAGMTSHMRPPFEHPRGLWCGPQCEPSYGPSCRRCGPSCGQPGGLRCGPPYGRSCGQSCGPPCGRRCGPAYGQPGGLRRGPLCRPPCGLPGGPPFMVSSYELGPNQGPWGWGPPFMNGPPQCACPWVKRRPPMNDFGPIFSPWNREPSHMQGSPAFGPMACPWNACPGWADKATDDRNDEERVGKEKADDVGEDTKKQEEEADDGKSGQQCPRCPWVNRMRRHRIRHADVHCCSMYRRCRQEFGAQLHCPTWSTAPSDCCPVGEGECPCHPQFFGPFGCDNAWESNSDPVNDPQKQGGYQPMPESFCPFSNGPSGSGDRKRGGNVVLHAISCTKCCHGNATY